MGTTTQNSRVEDWIIENARNLWLWGKTYKLAAAMATKDLGFAITPRRISRLRGEIDMRIPYPYDDWRGRCKRAGFVWETFLTWRQWERIRAWIIKNKEHVAKIRDVAVLAKLARVNHIGCINLITMRVALYETRRETGYDPNLLREDGAASGSDQGSVGVAPVATVGARDREAPAHCNA